jgi:hypothetical protein
MKYFMRHGIVIVSLLLSGTAYAGPTLIKDSRVRDLTSTPVLGRGYSISTNTFQSTCLKDVVITEPSYDFQYNFREMDATSIRTRSDRSTSSVSASYWWVSGTVSGSYEGSSKTERTTKHMVATLNMDSYYASVDESSTPLSESAIELLQRNDLPGFFAACGPYYIRGINRNAKFVSIFSYESKSSKSDSKFSYDLQLKIRGFWGGGGADIKQSGGGTRGSLDTSRNLMIRSRGWGLGKNEDASLISYDIDTFKAAIKQAFISMQNPLTGKVTSMEVVPWVENTEFQRYVNVKGDDKVSGKSVQLYEKKDILNMNAEFMTDMQRAARNRLNIYYKARVCKNQMRASFYRQGKLGAEFKSARVRNLRTGDNKVSLAKLDGELKDAKIAKLWTDYSTFMYKGTNNVSKCLGVLMTDPAEASGAAAKQKAEDGKERPEGSGRGLFLKRYTDHKECSTLEKQFAAQLNQIVDDHCMPEIAN